jgi:hypothetical protein
VVIDKEFKESIESKSLRGFSRFDRKVALVKCANMFEKADAAFEALEAARDLVGNLTVFCIHLQKQITELKN